MSTDTKPKEGTPPPAATDGQKSTDPAKKTRTPQEEAMVKVTSCKKIISTFITRFYGRDAAASVSSGELWDLRQTPRGFVADFYDMGNSSVRSWAIPVSSHVRQMPPSVADGLWKGWQDLVKSGVLRQ